jgi:RNA polymerase sigma-70 factor (ECF subfamily)
LMKIRDSYREAVILRDIQELSYEEVAEILDIEIGTVKSRINRGRSELQKYLKDIYND